MPLMNLAKPLTLLSLAACSLAAHAGPLDPPAGPVQPTMKTLEQVEPRILVNDENTPGYGNYRFVLNTPGSYYLDRSYLNQTTEYFIYIATDNVVLDLNGFTISGSTGASYGVFADSYAHRATVRNGTVKNFDTFGVYGRYADSVVLEDLSIADTTYGVYLGPNARVSRVTAASTGNLGIHVGDGSIVRDCISSDSLHGIEVGSGSSILNSVARDNYYLGFDLGNNSIIRDCLAENNVYAGIRCSPDDYGVLIEDCTVRSSDTPGAAGIVVGDRCVVRNNTVRLENTWTSCISLLGEGNRAEGNRTSGGDSAIRADNPKNLVINNVHTGPSDHDFYIWDGNIVGPVNSSNATINTDNPFANLWID